MSVVHDKKNKCFYINLGTQKAELSYNLTSDNVYELYRTYVPDEGRGQGYAKKLVEAAVEYVQESKGKIKPSCSYVIKYFENNPELSELKV